MKKLLSILILVSVFASCKKLLEEKPVYTVNSLNAFNDAASAQMALNACYGYMVEYSLYGQQYYELTLAPTGLTWAQTAAGDNDQLAALDVLVTNGTVSSVWSGLYKVIGECNAFVENVNKGSLSPESKAYFSAQAQFLRGLCYFNLVQLFGDVPLRLSITTPEDLNMARTPKAEIYPQIIADWTFAAANLRPRSALSATDIQMAVPTKYAAYAYLAKLYFLLGSKDPEGTTTNWTLAKQYGDSVLNSNTYSLEPNFNNLFKPGAVTSPEVIFQLNSSTALEGRGNRTNWLFSPASSTTGISWGRFRSTKAFYDLFAGTYPSDPRIDASFMTQWVTLNNGRTSYAYPKMSYVVSGVTKVDSIHYDQLANPTKPTQAELQAQNPQLATRFTKGTGNHEGWPYFKKYFDAGAAAQNSNKRLLVYRYADFLLLMADVYNEMGQSAKATELLNAVLNRARASAAGATQPAAITTSLTQPQLRNRIFFERLFELAGEPDTFWDVRRRGTDWFKKVLELNNTHPVTQAYVQFSAAAGATHNFRDRLYNNGNLDDEFLRKNLLLPIPQREINTNDKISLKDQNYGY